MKLFRLLLLVVLITPIVLLSDGAPWGVQFRGNGYIDMTNLIDQIEEDFTWSVWINMKDETEDEITGDKDIIMCTNKFSVGGSFSENHLLWFIGNDKESGYQQMYLHDGAYEATGQTINPDWLGPNYDFSKDKWYHVAFVFNKGVTDTTNAVGTGTNNIKLYVNGSEVLSYNTNTPAIGGITNYSVKLFQGADYDTGDEINDFFEGGMDELTIWNAALTETEIEALSAMGGDGASPGGAVGTLPTTANLVARFQYNDGDLSYNMSTQKITSNIESSEGGSHNAVPKDGPGATNKGVYAADYSDYSLPVVLSFFNAEEENGTVVLNWTTESEINNAGFNIYRSADDNSYEKLNDELIEGAINSSTANKYDFIDAQVKADTKYYYKLEDVSTSGETALHGPVTVITKNAKEMTRDFVLGAAYPNPFNPSTTINFMVAREAKIKINIYDMRGNLINTLTDKNYTVGSYQVDWTSVDFNGNPVSAGVYIYQMITSTGYTESAKMILIK